MSTGKRVGGVPSLDLPEDFGTSTSWERARTEETSLSRITRAEWMVRVGDGDLHRVTFALDDGHVFVRTPKSFEKMFNMREEYEKKAKSVIRNFEASGIRFSDEKVKRDWLAEGEIRILRKLFSVHENEIPKYATPDAIAGIIEKYDVDVTYQRQNGEIELDIDEYTDIWELLRVLNSDYAEAELIPDAKLEIESKRILD